MLRLTLLILVLAGAQAATPFVPAARAADPDAAPTIKELLSRLSLDRYKATIKGLTQFGDRREGTERNRAAVDWIEAQLKSYGCTNTERHRYELPPPTARTRDEADRVGEATRPSACRPARPTIPSGEAPGARASGRLPATRTIPSTSVT